MEARLPSLVLVVEDDPDALANIEDILALDGHQVDRASTMAELLDRQNWSTYSAIILDWGLPDGNSQKLLPRLRKLAPDAAIVVSTGAVGVQGAILALRHGAFDYLLKPVDADALRATLARAAERRQLAKEKARSEAAFRSLVEAAPSPIVILRPHGAILYFSPFAERLTGYSAAEALEKDFLRLFIRDEPARKIIQMHMDQIVRGKPLRGLETPLVCRDGSNRWMVWNAEHLEDYQGSDAVLAVGQDITELKEAQERALQSQRLAAIGEAMAGLAHESRNALQRSQACLEMLAREVKDRPRALNLIDRLQTAQDALHSLYEETREYAAPMRLELQRRSVHEIVQEAWTHLAASRSGRTARLSAGGALDACCEVDPAALEQVFRNLFENSLAACCDPVEIQVNYSIAEDMGRPSLRIAVRDNGPGLPPGSQQKVFEAFYTTKTKGTGLGLAIVKRIIEAHQGQICTMPGSSPGAEFVITLSRKTL